MPFAVLLALVLLGCQSASETTGAPTAPPPSSATPADTTRPAVTTGAAALAAEGFAPLRGRRVGLIVNHTALVGGQHLIDLVAATPEVELVALFGPEHGLRGEAGAGEKIEDGRDVQTGAPVYSLYGRVRKPTPQMLRGVDVLVFDIQDIGARFYTYISTMGLAMQAAAEQGIPFVVLDRPNPLGGVYVSGFMLEERQASFVGQYTIPMAHGMTVGELARMIKEERLLPGLDRLHLEVVEVEGWQRSRLWPATGLPWTPPSPNIPDFATALVYPGAALFEAASASEGRGTREPFKVLGAPWADGQALADTLNGRGLPGVRFEAATFTPVSIPGMAPSPKLEGQALQGVRYVLTDTSAFQPVETGIHVLHAFYHQAQRRGAGDFIARPEWLDKLSGTERLGRMLARGDRPEAIIAAWQDEVAAFLRRRAPYLLYP